MTDYQKHVREAAQRLGVSVVSGEHMDSVYGRILLAIADRLSPPEDAVEVLAPALPPEPPVAIGTVVRSPAGSHLGIVKSWEFYPAWGQWFLRVESGKVDDEGQPEYALLHDTEVVPIPEPPVGSGVFHDGVLWMRTVTGGSDWWSMGQGYRAWADLQPCVPAVPAPIRDASELPEWERELLDMDGGTE